MRLRTSLSPRALLARLHEIEAEGGRVRSGEQNTARTLDLDLLLYGESAIEETGICVPHPRMHERAFVLEPLRDVARSWLHPILGESIAGLAEAVRDPAAVRRRQD
jgi:2-amino-4-hydroxy-6-hydroxymethyldihydropteridine diphosphokinase